MKISVPKKYFSLIFIGGIVVVALLGLLFYSIFHTDYSSQPEQSVVVTHDVAAGVPVVVASDGSSVSNDTAAVALTSDALANTLSSVIPLMAVIMVVGSFGVGLLGAFKK